MRVQSVLLLGVSVSVSAYEKKSDACLGEDFVLFLFI